MGGILQVNGIPGFLSNADEVIAMLDPDVSAWREFTKAWYEVYGDRYMTTADLICICNKCSELSLLLGEKDNRDLRLGRLLSGKRDQVFGRLKIQRSTGRSASGVQWRVHPVGGANYCDDSADGDDNSGPT
jgi:hypothetical protein